MKTRRKLRSIALYLIVAIGAASAGYYLNALRPDMTQILKTDKNLSLDYYYTAQSFSEVENTKAQLQALSTQYLLESRGRRWTAQQKLACEPGVGGKNYTQYVESSIAELQTAIAEFKGTEQELVMVQDLLMLLKKEKRPEQWVQTYLETLYQRPTSTLVIDSAADALNLGKAVGREQEVLDALRHVRTIPFKFDGRERLEAVFLKANLEGQLAGSTEALP
jgi:hypothetical protein